MAQQRKLLVAGREAAAMIGVSYSHFRRHVQPHLPCVYSGQLRRYRPTDLERWVEQNVQTKDAA